MSVLIKDMQMPDNCDVCIFSDWSNLHQTSCCKLKEYEPGFRDYSRAFEIRRSIICPLVELPEHHGRLIDEDEIEIPSLETVNDQYLVFDAIKDAPTIIEVEGAE